MAHVYCERDFDEQAVDPTRWFDEQQRCPRSFSSAHYDFLGGNRLGLCFHVPTPETTVTWSYCKALCKSFHVNASLPVLRYAAESEFAERVRIAALRNSQLKWKAWFPGFYFKSYWAGATDLLNEGDWRWLDNSTLNSSSSLWWNGHPSKTTSEGSCQRKECALVHGRKLGAVDCDSRAICMCQVPNATRVGSVALQALPVTTDDEAIFETLMPLGVGLIVLASIVSVFRKNFKKIFLQTTYRVHTSFARGRLSRRGTLRQLVVQAENLDELRFESAIDKSGWLFFAFNDGAVEVDFHDYIVQRHLNPMRESLVSFFLPFYNFVIIMLYLLIEDGIGTGIDDWTRKATFTTALFMTTPLIIFLRYGVKAKAITRQNFSHYSNVIAALHYVYFLSLGSCSIRYGARYNFAYDWLVRGFVLFSFFWVPRAMHQDTRDALVLSILAAFSTEVMAVISLNDVNYACSCFETININVNKLSVLMTHAFFWSVGIVTCFFSIQQHNQLRRLHFFKLRVKAEELENAKDAVRDLEAANDKIRKELETNGLSDEQRNLVDANSNFISSSVPSRFVIDFEDLTFETHLGSGAFGDAFKGLWRSTTPVAIKRMRAGLVDEQGFKAFGQEVRVLASLHHTNVISFLGYGLSPVLLIVMEFAEKGTLKDFVKVQKEKPEPPKMALVIKILLGVASALEYLHGQSPVSIIHRDIKSENVLLTLDMVPKLGDLGEARASANHTMTTVGTRGYSAPEMLRGGRYGTPADIFSFAIVMSELVTLRAPYSDMLFDESGRAAISWDALVQLTVTKDLRPSLPVTLDGSLRKLIESCWDPDPVLRPSATVIAKKLTAMELRLEDAKANGRNGDSQAFNSMIYLKSVRINSRQNALSKMEVVKVCSTLASAMRCCFDSVGEWDKGGKVSKVVSKTCKATAEDPIFNEILRSGKGPRCIQQVGILVFGHQEQNSQLVPEPLLNSDVDWNEKSGKAILHLKGTIVRVKEVDERSTRVGCKTVSEDFEGLEQALADEVAEQNSGLDSFLVGLQGQSRLMSTVLSSAGSVMYASTNKKKTKKKKKRKLKARLGKDSMLEGEIAKDFARFVKATRYVRAQGKAAMAPSLLVSLHGLFMQANCGDYDNEKAHKRAGKARKLSEKLKHKAGFQMLEKLQYEAWKGRKGMARANAMKQYIDIVDEAAPNWRVASILGKRSKHIDQNTKVMVVLELEIHKKDGQSVLEAMHVLQATNEGFNMVGMAKNVIEAQNPGEMMDMLNKSGEGVKIVTLEDDPFVTGLPSLNESDFLMEVCLDGLPHVDSEKRADGDVRKFETVEEQNSFAEKAMLWMARKGHDEEDGWELASVIEPGIEVFQRDVGAWPTSKQYRAREHGVKATPRQTFELLCSSYFSRRRKALKERDLGDNAHELFELSGYGPDYQMGIRYRRLAFPWPLMDRDFLYNHVFMIREGVCIGFAHSIRSAKVPDRENHIRGDIAWQGYVALETTVGEMDLTALVSTGFGGGSFRIPQAFTRPALVKYTTMGHTLKLKLIAANQEKKQGGEGEEGADN